MFHTKRSTSIEKSPIERGTPNWLCVARIKPHPITRQLIEKANLAYRVHLREGSKKTRAYDQGALSPRYRMRRVRF
jgi:hypothetical protein